VAIDDAIERHTALFVQGRLLQASREYANLVTSEEALPVAFKNCSKLRVERLGISARKLPIADAPLVVLFL
jgi:hypothetical protein